MKKTIFLLLLLTLTSCSDLNKSKMVNPTPPPDPKLSENGTNKVSKIPDIFKNAEFEDLKPLEQEELNLSKNNYDIEIHFDVVLGRVSIDDGELKEIPAKYTLKGGSHKMVLFDIVTGCQVRKIITVDKNGKIEFKKEDEC